MLATIVAFLWNAISNNGPELFTACLFFVPVAVMLWWIDSSLLMPEGRCGRRSSPNPSAEQIDIPRVATSSARTELSGQPLEIGRARGARRATSYPRGMTGSAKPNEQLALPWTEEPPTRMPSRPQLLSKLFRSNTTTSQVSSDIPTLPQDDKPSTKIPERLQLPSKLFWSNTTRSQISSVESRPSPCLPAHETRTWQADSSLVNPEEQKIWYCVSYQTTYLLMTLTF